MKGGGSGGAAKLSSHVCLLRRLPRIPRGLEVAPVPEKKVGVLGGRRTHKHTHTYTDGESRKNNGDLGDRCSPQMDHVASLIQRTLSNVPSLQQQRRRREKAFIDTLMISLQVLSDCSNTNLSSFVFPPPDFPCSLTDLILFDAYFSFFPSLSPQVLAGMCGSLESKGCTVRTGVCFTA